jgi:alpha-methylacyl-CoA racemase
VASRAGPGPLAGLRVVELAGIGPAPFAAMLLADLGADVLRVDRPGATPMQDPRTDLVNRGRRSACIDLKDPRGADVVLRLVERADVLIEGFRPGVAERLGVGPERCLARNPRLVYGRMSGWGQDGPWAGAAGHDITYLAVTGALHATGRAGGPPQVPVNLLGDFGGGAMSLVVGLLSALWEAQRSGTGQVVDASVVDGTASLTTMLHGLLAGGQWQDERGVNLLDTGAPFYDVYETADGRHMAVGALEPQFYSELVRLLFDEARPPGLPERLDRDRWPELRRLFADRFRSRTQQQWAEVFDGTDACVAPVLSLTEAPEHPQLAGRGTFVESRGVTQPGPAPRFSRTPASLADPPPLPGQHTAQALRDWGIDDVDDLLAAGVVVADA